jgi:hypothetical protein
MLRNSTHYSLVSSSKWDQIIYSNSKLEDINETMVYQTLEKFVQNKNSIINLKATGEIVIIDLSLMEFDSKKTKYTMGFNLFVFNIDKF